MIIFLPLAAHQDVPLISLANIFQNARLWEDALTVARMAVEIAPHFVVNHFTLANVYITMVASLSLHFLVDFSPSVCLFLLKTVLTGCWLIRVKENELTTSESGRLRDLH